MPSQHVAVLVYFDLRYPIGQYVHNQIGICRIVRLEMNPKVMRTVHAFVHHEDTGFNDRAFARIEYHRTDGQLRRSAPLQYFNVRFIFES